jgi:hypothetical protein
MHEELRGIYKHMQRLGFAALSHAMQHIVFINYSIDNHDLWDDLAVLQVGHAAEILIKACIAEQHPLLIFSQLPNSTQIDNQMLNAKALIEFGRTIQYQELPEKLWATTGYNIKNIKLYQNFGKLRNSIQHFASPVEENLQYRNLEFIFGVIDPLINHFWRLYAIDFIEDTDGYEYVLDCLIANQISFSFPEEHQKDITKRKNDILR